MQERFQTRPISVAGGRAIEARFSRVVVTVEEGCDREREATLSSSSLRVGTDPSNDLVLSDLSVSRQHALFTLTAAGVQLEDLGSTNGSWFNGARIQSGCVPDGSLVRLGESTLRVRIATDQTIIFPDGEPPMPGFIGRSQVMSDLFALIRLLARTDLPVLVTGPTGSGKDVVARALHAASPRRTKPFIVLDCGSIVEGLLRSEIFGFERGAFTGAERTTPGVLEAADGGTVFLDEVGEIDLAVQPNLLRALETREVCRIGSRKTTPVDFRLVAATNRNLAEMASTGRFREDLFYRLSCVTIRVPPLADRREDIPPLAHHFLSECAARNRLPRPELTVAALDRLLAHPWPGNVRELKNTMEAICAISDGSPVQDSLIERVFASGQQPGTAAPHPAESLDALERIAIIRALEATGWRRKAAARRLGISATTLFERIKRYGLKPPPSFEK